jgi:hypothetical protein
MTAPSSSWLATVARRGRTLTLVLLVLTLISPSVVAGVTTTNAQFAVMRGGIVVCWPVPDGSVTFNTGVFLEEIGGFHFSLWPTLGRVVAFMTLSSIRWIMELFIPLWMPLAASAGVTLFASWWTALLRRPTRSVLLGLARELGAVALGVLVTLAALFVVGVVEFPDRFRQLDDWAEWARIAVLVVVPLLVSVLLGVLTYHRVMRGRRRTPDGHCTRCGYNLYGNVSGRCPECGQPCGPV